MVKNQWQNNPLKQNQPFSLYTACHFLQFYLLAKSPIQSVMFLYCISGAIFGMSILSEQKERLELIVACKDILYTEDER